MIIITRKVVTKWPKEVIESVEVMGVWDDVEIAKEYIRKYAKRLFEAKQMMEVQGYSGTLFTWECPGRSPNFTQRFEFSSVQHNRED